MGYREKAMTFSCRGDALVGIVALPSDDPPSAEIRCKTAVIIIVGGPQYRAGSHRQFTLLARAAADAGFPVLRFDYRGMGDSTGECRNFEQVVEDVSTAIDALQQLLPHVTQVVLWGLCDGASAALLYLHACADERVVGLCLVNPWVRSEQSLAQTRVRSYYARRLLSPTFWKSMLSGRVPLTAARDFSRALTIAVSRRSSSGPSSVAECESFICRMSSAACTFNGDLLIVVCERDMTGEEFAIHASVNSGWKTVLKRPRATLLKDAYADHTFSQPCAQLRLEQYTIDWLRKHAH